jgi:hypothetical protein
MSYEFKSDLGEITLLTPPANEIKQAIDEAISMAFNNGWFLLGSEDRDRNRQGALVKFDFNGVTVRVRWDSDPELIYRDWDRAMSGYTRRKSVGPYPPKRLSAKTLAHDEEVCRENQRRHDEWCVERKAKDDAKRAATEAKLADAPEMEFSDAQKWAEHYRINEHASYGRGIFEFAERWARLMQARIASGERLEDIADDTSSTANIDDITGFMYGAAVMELSACWIHGEQLRVWHNAMYGVENSDGVVNPAVFTIG